jgi:hypothetical protein
MILRRSARRPVETPSAFRAAEIAEKPRKSPEIMEICAGEFDCADCAI